MSKSRSKGLGSPRATHETRAASQAKHATASFRDAAQEIDRVEARESGASCFRAFKRIVDGQGQLQAAQENIIASGETKRAKKSDAYRTWSAGDRILTQLEQRFGRVCVK